MTAKEKKAMRARAYKEANRAKYLAEKKASYERHKERILAQQKSKREADPEGFYAHRRELYAANRARIREKDRQRYAADAEYAARVKANNRKYYAARPEVYRERGRKSAKAHREKHRERFLARLKLSNDRRRAVQLGVFAEVIHPLTVFRRDKGVCGICHQPVDPKSKWHVDHVYPLAKGGVHSYDNVQLAHARCNWSKQARLPKGQLGLFQKVAVR
jgi:5-methylcytosine-specific restriction endonuclease McrA